MRRFAVLGVIVLLTLFPTDWSFGQTAEDLKSLREEIKALKESQTAIQKDLQEIKNLLRAQQAQPQAPPAFKEAIVSIDTGHVQGDKNAKLVMFEFSEYQ